MYIHYTLRLLTSSCPHLQKRGQVQIFNNDFDFEDMTEGDIIAAAFAIMGALVAGSIVLYIIRILYGAFMESSK